LEIRAKNMPKKILSVGSHEIPGGEIESINLHSRRSLLDADIIVFSPEIPYSYGSDTYKGKNCLSDDASFRAKESIAHWNRELAAALEAGKLIIVLLRAPEIVFVATGQTQTSGTGRTARVNRIVEELSAYAAIPTKWKYHSASGSEMALVAEARFLAPY
jgi:hypothetical protein